jgi:hypothetical protein
LPASAFGYQVCNPPDELAAGSEIVSVGEAEPPGLDNPSADFVDLNGDGLPDLVKTQQGAHVGFLNRGPELQDDQPVVRWERVEGVAADSGAGGFDLGDRLSHLADMDGDGWADFVHKTLDGEVFYFANTGTKAWAARPPMALDE